MRAELMGYHPQAHAISTTRRDQPAESQLLNGAASQTLLNRPEKAPKGNNSERVTIKSLNPGILLSLP